MSDFSMAAGFAAQVEKLGIIGFLVLFLIYFVYNHMVLNKQMATALQDLKDQTKELNAILRQQLDFQSKFIGDLRDDIKDIKSKTSDMHLHCKESANLIRDKIQGGSYR
ncbi:hypothetical protein CIG2463D_0975 [Campylobacter iguaniorum]|uniref:hypothetical protein n=1 Tax=Campylobacter iguaniorum TaxID=1244531 RepID=UPI00073A456C|nr:hypothetical protein [Campylobacter iguaniorum]ALV24548.1 hypothetical protein CIG2463D_0975 [Campylobacter iguaniorum]